jgi:hypothetical protein
MPNIGIDAYKPPPKIRIPKHTCQDAQCKVKLPSFVLSCTLHETPQEPISLFDRIAGI